MSHELAIVTGATGHLGNVLVRALLARGCRVRALVQAGDDVTALKGLELERSQGDVLAPEALAAAFEGAQVVFHLAGVVSITRGHEALMHRVNVDGTRRVLEACRRRRVPRLVHVGSVHALAEVAQGVLDETAGFDPSRAFGPYAQSKSEACLEVQRAARQGLQDSVLVLPTGVVGPWDFRLSEVGQVVVLAGTGRLPWVVPGSYDWIDVRDVATGLVAAWEKGRSGEAYLLGGQRLSPRELAQTVARAAGRRGPAVVPLWLARAAASAAWALERLTGRRALLTPYALRTLQSPFVVSHDKARGELGFTPRPVEQALVDAWQWQCSHPDSPLNRRLRPAPGRRLAATEG